jgi:Protein of unknown function (DUF3617)
MILRRFSSCLIVFCAAAAASAQTATPPPVKMGLWETSVTSKMGGGMQLPPDVVARLQAMGRPVPGAPHTMVSQGCLTPAEWQKSMEHMNQPSNAECQYANQQSSGGKYSFDISCKTQRGQTMKGHFEMLIDDTEHSHGSYHMTSDQPGQNGQPFTVDATIETHYLGTDCGDVQPGSGKVIKQ